MSEGKSEGSEIYVVSLKRTPERFADFMRLNGAMGLNIVKWDAVDGQTLNRPDLIARSVIAEDLIFTNGSIGCALSHIQLWQRCVESGLPMTVCEDDAVLHRDFIRARDAFMASQPDFDLIYWGYNHDMHVTYVHPEFGECTTVFDKHRFNDEANIDKFRTATFHTNMFRAVRLYGTLSYTISPQCARLFLDNILPIRNISGTFAMQAGLGGLAAMSYQSWGIDMHLGITALAHIKGFAMVPPIVVSPNDKAASTVGGQLRVHT